ncbi:aspartyl protease family protein [Paracnuella aquatica]|uniref:aspartyl protease family protein n=1 Tax=Paracnuella aquatica TaxID=2268757 RepID=UPI000DEF195D|nr:aspartyl protease family protein [Paracnuella aquatica]RPD50984.1 PDZ domain-containing protein [Paracnuella aquatica]
MNATRLLLICIFLLQGFGAAAQEEFIQPSRRITRMPMELLTGGVMILQARYSDKPDTLNFILDTGSGGISLDSTTVEYFGLKPTPSNRTIRGVAGIREVSFLYNQQLHLPGLTVDSLNFHVNDYSLLTSVYGMRIDGIIGYSVLSRYIVKLNFDSSYVEFWTRGAIRYPRGGFLMKPFINTLPITTARVRDQEAANTRFLFDMGAGLNMMLSTDFVKDSALLHRKRKLWAKQAQGLGGKIDMQLTVIREVKLGPYRFRNVPVYVFEDEFNITSYPYMGGLIGNDLLRRFNIILNYDKRDFYLEPNKHFTDAFDYTYTGIELYYDRGVVLLGDVAKDSPAEAAGLKEGDVVIAINKNFVQSLQSFKSELQRNRERIKIIVLRNGVLQEFDFKMQSILKKNRRR